MSALTPKDLDLYRDLGRRYERLGRPADAERAYTSLVEAVPNESAGHATLAEIRRTGPLARRRQPLATGSPAQHNRPDRPAETGHRADSSPRLARRSNDPAEAPLHVLAGTLCGRGLTDRGVGGTDRAIGPSHS